MLGMRDAGRYDIERRAQVHQDTRWLGDTLRISLSYRCDRKVHEQEAVTTHNRFNELRI
jgi:hypothetical protein